jgi:hypothetical protein
MTNETDQGSSIEDLLIQIEQLDIEQSLLGHLRQTALKVIGENWTLAETTKFDAHLADLSLAIFDMKDIDRPSQIPPTVSNVKFRCDLQLTPRLHAVDLANNKEVLVLLKGFIQ